jgi:hypothetical protein
MVLVHCLLLFGCISNGWNLAKGSGIKMGLLQFQRAWTLN